MLKPFIILFVGLLLNVMSGGTLVHCQEEFNPEEEFMRIRTLAFDGKYDEAVTAARKLLNAYPSYGDVRILLGRVLAWQKDYEQAAAVIDTLLMTEPLNADAIAARNDIRQWAKVYTPVSTDLRAGYYFDTFSEPYTRFWQVFSAGAGHRFGFGPVAAYVNMGNLTADGTEHITATEFQFEVEAYPTLSRKNYAYLDYAYSPGTYFPTHRAAVELWQMLPAGWGISAGLNYYYFNRDIFIALASVEKYIGKYWLSGKCYVYFKDDGPTTSFYLNARRYFDDIDYLQLTLGTGTAPDEPFDIQSDIMRLSANSVRLTYYGRLSRRFFLRVGAGYSREEYEESVLRNRFEGNVNLIYAIRLK